MAIYTLIRTGPVPLVTLDRRILENHRFVAPELL
jgi:hypothetical protein